MYVFRRLLNPEIFQGRHRKRNYFEGWYFKLIDAGMDNAVAVIPGVAYGNSAADRHAFVQVLDALNCKTYYIRYDLSDFKYNDSLFEIRIGANYFSGSEIELNISDKQLKLNGRLAFCNIVPFPKTIFKPGIMGPFSYVPFMECHHGIVNMHHRIEGRLTLTGRDIDLNGGYGYIEKDWGSSFPEVWVWLQSNHFGNDDVTLMFSAAKIPWLGRSFMGFISFIRIRREITIFATYNRSRITGLNYDNNCLVISLQGRRSKMRIEARHSDGGILKAPKNGLMYGEILESITAEVRVTLFDNHGRVIYEGTGTHTGLEISDDMINSYFAGG